MIFRFTGLVHENALQILPLILSLILKAFRLVCKSTSPYEWGYTYGPPMAVAPIEAVRRVVEFALTQMEPGKILLGFPNYAYDWTLPFTAGATRAQSIGNEAAPLLAAQYGAEIQFDEQAQTPYFTYLDEAGQPHEVWFEDARSALAKFGLLTEYGLLGLGCWNFMRPFAAGFSLQNYLFSIL